MVLIINCKVYIFVINKDLDNKMLICHFCQNFSNVQDHHGCSVDRVVVCGFKPQLGLTKT